MRKEKCKLNERNERILMTKSNVLKIRKADSSVIFAICVQLSLSFSSKTVALRITTIMREQEMAKCVGMIHFKRSKQYFTSNLKA